MMRSRMINWLTRKCQQPNPRPRPKVNLQLEKLEAREVPASLVNGLLTIEGTNYNDDIRVSQQNTTLTVKHSYFNGSNTISSSENFSLSGSNKVTKIKILGYNGDDTISMYGVNVAGEVYGGAGNDAIYGGLQGDTIYGNDGNDKIYGNDGNDYLSGGAGDDKIYGYTGNDTIYGGDGNDTLAGNADRDKIFGNDGNDTIYGVFGEDLAIAGGAGDDMLYMIFNLDTFYRNKGYNTFGYSISGVDTFYVDMNLGSTGRYLISQFINQTKQFTSRLQPIVNLLNQKLTLPNGYSSPTLGQLLGGNYNAVAGLINTVNKFDPTVFQARTFHLGRFKVDANWKVTIQSVGSLASQPFAGQLNRLSKYIDVSFLTNATRAFQIAMNYNNIDLFRLNLGRFSINSGQLKKNLGTYWLGPVPIRLTLNGSLNLGMGGSIVYDITGLRENNLIRGLKLNYAWAELRVPVSISATAGDYIRVLGQSLMPSVSATGSVTGKVIVTTANLRLGSGQSLASNLKFKGGLYYALSLSARYPEAYWNSLFDNGIRWKNASWSIFSGWLKM